MRLVAGIVLAAPEWAVAAVGLGSLALGLLCGALIGRRRGPR